MKQTVRYISTDKRRKALKALAVAAPAVWAKPAVDSVVLPAHATTTCAEAEVFNFEIEAHRDADTACFSLQNPDDCQPYIDCMLTYCVLAPQDACCFLAGTQVLLRDGNTKTIETLEIGDQLASYDFSRNEVVHSPVNILHKGGTESYFNIDGIHITGSPPFSIGENN